MRHISIRDHKKNEQILHPFGIWIIILIIILIIIFRMMQILSGIILLQSNNDESTSILKKIYTFYSTATFTTSTATSTTSTATVSEKRDGADVQEVKYIITIILNNH